MITWRAFPDTPASAAGIDSFVSVPDYNTHDYFEGPSDVSPAGDTCQFNREAELLVLDSPVMGLVAVLSAGFQPASRSASRSSASLRTNGNNGDSVFRLAARFASSFAFSMSPSSRCASADQ